MNVYNFERPTNKSNKYRARTKIAAGTLVVATLISGGIYEHIHSDKNDNRQSEANKKVHPEDARKPGYAEAAKASASLTDHLNATADDPTKTVKLGLINGIVSRKTSSSESSSPCYPCLDPIVLDMKGETFVKNGVLNKANVPGWFGRQEVGDDGKHIDVVPTYYDPATMDTTLRVGAGVVTVDAQVRVWYKLGGSNGEKVAAAVVVNPPDELIDEVNKSALPGWPGGLK